MERPEEVKERFLNHSIAGFIGFHLNLIYLFQSHICTLNWFQHKMYVGEMKRRPTLIAFHVRNKLSEIASFLTRAALRLISVREALRGRGRGIKRPHDISGINHPIGTIQTSFDGPHQSDLKTSKVELFQLPVTSQGGQTRSNRLDQDTDAIF